jgi:cellulose synthase/poly-beta-1,6-N-acetylglucosamine synthase-like glycosyltransferase
MKISVLVPTYRRSKDLAHCLEALKKQSLPADEVLVVVRDIDEETHQFLLNFEVEKLPLKIVCVSVPGQVAALNAGLAVALGDIISITDDDAAPHPDWLQKIEAHFEVNSSVGGVGGRDCIHIDGLPGDFGKARIVGRLKWFGRAIGNHHIGVEGPIEVDILKGANMSYRKLAIQDLKFDGRLRGSGAQVHNDLMFSLQVKRRGWKVIYDPSVCVDHFPAQRFDEDMRGSFNSAAVINQSHNEYLAILSSLPHIFRIIFIMWSNLIGTRSSPGLLQVIRLLPTERLLVVKRAVFCAIGHYQGLRTWLMTNHIGSQSS